MVSAELMPCREFCKLSAPNDPKLNSTNQTLNYPTPIGSHANEISIFFKNFQIWKFQMQRSNFCEDCHREFLEKSLIEKESYLWEE